MIPFDPTDPFPLLPLDAHDYAEAQEHSSKVDSYLGLRTEEIEAELQASRGSQARNQQLWIGLPVKSMQTPYTEIRQLLSQLALKPGEAIVDLGAAYGRMAFVIGRHYPEVKFIGYELVAERVREGQRCLAMFNYLNVTLEQADLAAASFQPIRADYYFLYDFGTRDAIEKTLQDLREIACERPIAVIGRGRGSRDAIEHSHPWLSQVREPKHFAHYSIYRS